MGRNWGSRWLALSLLGLASVASADQICADRPGKASATCTAPDGHLQLEVGLVDWLQHGSSLTIFSTAIKYGVTKRSHVEIDIAPLTRADDEWGFGDVVARYKHQLTNEGSAIAVTAYPFVKIPTAKSPIGNGKVEAGLIMPVGYSIPGSGIDLVLGPEIDWAANSKGSGHHLGMSQVIGVGDEVARRLSLSAELWGHWDWDPDGRNQQFSIDGSAAYLVRDDIQLDAGANVGLNRATPDLELYAGTSIRF